MTKVYAVVGCVILILGMAAQAGAQGIADIVGRVTEASGASVPNATVTARDTGTNVLRTTTSSNTGDYTFTALPIGTYEVKTVSIGFETETSQITLAAGDRARVDVKLTVGAVTQTVEVETGAQQLQTDSAEISTDIQKTLVQNEPVINRNIVSILQLTPGAAEGNATATISGNRPDDRRESSAIAIDGMPENEPHNMIDGNDNEERVMGGMGVKPDLEGIQEVSVQYNSYGADLGRSLSGVVNIVMKSGTNNFHGSVYEYFKNDVTDATPYFALTRPPDHQNQFGGSLGGPIRHDKTFFFYDFDMQRIANSYSSVITVPTGCTPNEPTPCMGGVTTLSGMRAGDFSALLPATVIYDPGTDVNPPANSTASGPSYIPAGSPRTPFPNNMIPQARWDLRAQALMNLYPNPNVAGIGNNYVYNGPMWQNNETMDFRIDQIINSTNTLFGRFTFNLTNGTEASQCPDANTNINGSTSGLTFDPVCNTQGTNGIYSGPYHSYAYAIALNWTHIYNPRLLSVVTVNFFHPFTGSYDPNVPNAATELGYQNVNYLSTEPVTGGLPWFQMNPTTDAALGDPTFIQMMTQDHDMQAEGSLTWNHGAHSFKWGGGAIYRMFGVWQSQYPRSAYIFASGDTSNGSGVGGNTFASFVLGIPDQEQRIVFPVPPLNRSWEPNLYAMDSWRATSWLTVNAGLRYEIFTPVTEAYNRQSSFNLTTDQIDVAGVNGTDPQVNVATDYADWGPRFGFAATLPQHFVLRGGYGIVYDPVLRGAGSYNKNAPFTQNFGPFTSNSSSGGAVTLSLEDNPLPLAFNSVTAPAGTMGWTAPNYKNPMAEQFNVALEKQLGGFLVSAEYVGYIAQHYPLNINHNLPPIEPTPAGGTVNNNRPFYSLFPAVTTMTQITSEGKRTYSSGVAKVERRYSRGLAINSYITWGQAREDLPEPWNNNARYWGDIPTYDIRLKWVLMSTYDIPVGSNFTGIAHAALSGWQTNVLTFWSTGIDYGIYDSSSQTNQGLGEGSDEGPNLVPGCNPNNAPHSVKEYYNPACFTVPAKYAVGNVGLGTMHGPPQRSLLIALAKSFPIGKEQRSIYFRAEAYNVTNTPSFQPPDGAINDGTQGTLSSTGNAQPRTFQFALKYIF